MHKRNCKVFADSPPISPPYPGVKIYYDREIPSQVKQRDSPEIEQSCVPYLAAFLPWLGKRWKKWLALVTGECASMRGFEVIKKGNECKKPVLRGFLWCDGKDGTTNNPKSGAPEHQR